VAVVVRNEFSGHNVVVSVHVGVVNFVPGMEISTILIANVDMLCASLYDPSCDMAKCSLIVAIDRERRCVFAVYITVQLE
jgi:hypothetical protein